MIPMDIINIYENYNSYFNDEFKNIFKLLSDNSFEHNFKIYLIGGLVRDLLLNRKSLDIDITIEGDAIEFAHILEKKGQAKILSIHKDFGTIKVEILGREIDFASTRSESYPKKGHLPHVDEIGCSLKNDVLRRDFTINSLALSLNKGDFCDLIDYTGGFKDLKNKKIKVLHKKSFIDDPTRIIRGLKYSTRFDFGLDKETLKLQEEYLKNINYDMGFKRIKQEIKKTFEQNSQEAFDKFIDQNIYKLVTKNSIKKPEKSIEKLINTYPPKQPWLVYFGILVIKSNANQFALTKYEKEVINDAKMLQEEILNNDFEIYKTFKDKHLETLLILANLGKEKEVSHYLNDLKKIKLNITGKDLIKLGFEPSKKFNKIFDFILMEKFKIPEITKSQELELVKKHFN